MLRERRQVQGYTDLGRIRIPPLPPYIIMTDRDTGTLWLLSWNLTTASQDGKGYVSITDVIPSTPDKLVYGPYDGPYVQEQNAAQGSPVIRLLIRGSRLGYEMVSTQSLASIDNQPVLTRQGLVFSFREIIVPATWKQEKDTLGWRYRP